MKTAILLWYYKLRLKRSYLKYLDACDEYSCGASLLDHLSPHKADANYFIERINKIDTDANLKLIS